MLPNYSPLTPTYSVLKRSPARSASEYGSLLALSRLALARAGAAALTLRLGVGMGTMPTPQVWGRHCKRSSEILKYERSRNVYENKESSSLHCDSDTRRTTNPSSSAHGSIPFPFLDEERLGVVGTRGRLSLNVKHLGWLRCVVPAWPCMYTVCSLTPGFRSKASHEQLPSHPAPASGYKLTATRRRRNTGGPRTATTGCQPHEAGERLNTR
jgi:hypothetical protein